ncbi:MAG: nitrite/sulfite reductase, partial [Xanthobacteraceae bacterium]
MYVYDAFDWAFLEQRVDEFRDQVRRRLSGELTEDEFKLLRLLNGVYLQLHAYMLRIGIPYGTLSSEQMRALAHVARTYDRGYGHFTTRQNIQFHWIKLEELPDAMAYLGRARLHGIQTSGNSVRNVTTDQWAGVAPDEIEDARIWGEIVRQHCTLHPEFTFLPRKFKIAITAAPRDRAAIKIHDISLRLYKNDAGKTGFEVGVGGGLGRIPYLAQIIKPFLAKRDLLSYIEAILRVYNQYGRRDNIHKARIKILVKERGAERFRSEVEAEWAHLKNGPATLTQAEVDRVAARFTHPEYEPLPDQDLSRLGNFPGFAAWLKRNVHRHKVRGYAAVTLSLKKTGVPPGDVTADQMEAIAGLADRYSFGELRVSHEQNLILADVRQHDLAALWSEARALGLATPNIGLITNIIACPGGDFCSLANAKSIPVAQALQERFDDLDYQHDIGELDLNISGCM